MWNVERVGVDLVKFAFQVVDGEIIIKSFHLNKHKTHENETCMENKNFIFGKWTELLWAHIY